MGQLLKSWESLQSVRLFKRDYTIPWFFYIYFLTTHHTHIKPLVTIFYIQNKMLKEHICFFLFFKIYFFFQIRIRCV